MTVALIALAIALGGTATASVYIVPLAANSKRLQGKTAAQVAAIPGPASTAQSLVSIRTSHAVLNAGAIGSFFVGCGDAGQVVNGGWYAIGGTVVPGGDSPVIGGAMRAQGAPGQTGWGFFLNNVLGTTAADLTLYAVCIK
jgi:hypothetical protein